MPEQITFAAWAKAWGSACTGVRCDGLKPYMWNSVLMVVPSVLLSSILGAINGYALAQWRFRGADALFTFLLLGFFVPFQAIILPAAQLLGILGLSNTVGGLVMIHVIYGIAFTTMLFRNFYVSIPGELVKAARIDGAGFMTIFRHIFLPLSLPTFVVCIIWQFTGIWNDFLFGVVFSGIDARPGDGGAEQPGQHLRGGQGIQRRHGRGAHHGAADPARLRRGWSLFRSRPDGRRRQGLSSTGARHGGFEHQGRS